ncbi:hypothetical protein Ga0100231_000385 [Opitutaceae bacterium TAV4]|nr:hypothetical protein Ga0100231_000385 [Opitutaceae bacterium TAV4]RRK01650.1 hypothetical protein Ga0100230_007380 [Opitutaceae bacterium TAV3]
MNHKTSPGFLFPREVSRSIAAFAFLFTVCASALVATSQTILVQDSFTLNTSDREAGDSLRFTAPDTAYISGATWAVNGSDANAAFVFSATGTITNGLDTADARITIPSPVASVTVQADIVTGSGGNGA